MLPLADTVREPSRESMALVQLCLKLRPEVLEEWRRRAAEAGHGRSVRDWLLSVLSPTAEETPALADRVAALEEAVAELRQQQARPAAPRRAVPVASPPQALPGADTAVLVTGEGIETAALADRLGMRRGTLTERIRRTGGPRPGLELHGWRCLGSHVPARGGPPRALWVPTDTAVSTGGKRDESGALVPGVTRLDS